MCTLYYEDVLSRNIFFSVLVLTQNSKDWYLRCELYMLKRVRRSLMMKNQRDNYYITDLLHCKAGDEIFERII